MISVDKRLNLNSFDLISNLNDVITINYFDRNLMNSHG